MLLALLLPSTEPLTELATLLPSMVRLLLLKIVSRTNFLIKINKGATAGSSDDWAKGGAGIKYAYTGIIS